jgi:tRNA-dihydrouridine synthase B
MVASKIDKLAANLLRRAQNITAVAVMNPTGKKSIFKALGLPEQPLFLAPLAGVSDSPFRRVSTRGGADLCYVEMLSAVALQYRNTRTLEMLVRHPSETKLGVQVTGKSPEDIKPAIDVLNEYNFTTIDLNMGCPVRKVVGQGCGAALLRDVNNVHAVVDVAVRQANCPVSVKIRLGWDERSRNYLEVAQAAESAGAAWITLHGRTRNDDYSREVDLNAIAELKAAVNIPVIGNGNIFNADDARYMLEKTKADGLMVSRGALGNPWIFRDIKEQGTQVSLSEWTEWLLDHLTWQIEHHGDRDAAIIMMRKNLLWYLKGWPQAKAVRERLGLVVKQKEASEIIREFSNSLATLGVSQRHTHAQEDRLSTRFSWDPKFDMDRQADQAAF